MFLCASVADNGVCESWVPYVGVLPPLSISDAIALSSAAFGVWAIAWGVRQVVGAILNR